MARAIDAEKTMDELLYGEAYISDELADYIRRVFDKQPTIDPVKHGEWEFGKSHEEFVEAECTACGGVLLVKWYDKLSEYNYCPRCGARMDGDSE